MCFSRVKYITSQTLLGEMSKTSIKPLAKKDIPWLLDETMKYVNDTEVTKNFAKFDHRFTRNYERAYLTRLLASKADKVFAIENGKHEYIGTIGLHQIYWPAKNARLGIIIGNKKEWGKGHAQRAIALLLNIAFKKMKLNKVWVICYVTNHRMKHIMEKMGFVEEGILREEYFHKDHYHDMVRLSLLRREWKEL